MRTVRWRAAACGAALGLALTLLPATVAVPPAAASDGNFLQVTPEVSDVQVGVNVTLTAHLFDSTLASLLGRRPPLTLLQPVVVRFAFEGGPLQGTADTSCTVSESPFTCSISVGSTKGGTTLVRAWIDPHAPDASEGRLANNLAPSAFNADCIDAEDGESPACATTDTPAAGAAAEPDSTDVVKLTWRERGLDLSPDNQERLLNETASVKAAVNDRTGNPLADVQVGFELFEGSVSDAGGTNTPNIPDKTCTTGADGTCTITITQSAAGTDLICAWTATTPPTMSGKATETGTCAGETLFDTSANDGKPSPLDDAIDVARIVWKAPAPPTTTPSTVPGG